MGWLCHFVCHPLCHFVCHFVCRIVIHRLHNKNNYRYLHQIFECHLLCRSVCRLVCRPLCHSVCHLHVPPDVISIIASTLRISRSFILPGKTIWGTIGGIIIYYYAIILFNININNIGTSREKFSKITPILRRSFGVGSTCLLRAYFKTHFASSKNVRIFASGLTPIHQ